MDKEWSLMEDLKAEMRIKFLLKHLRKLFNKYVYWIIQMCYLWFVKLSKLSFCSGTTFEVGWTWLFSISTIYRYDTILWYSKKKKKRFCLWLSHVTSLYFLSLRGHHSNRVNSLISILHMLGFTSFMTME